MTGRPVRIAILTNFIPPYRVPLFRALRALGNDIAILVSTPMEAGRPWPADWADLPVTLQRTFTLRRRHRHGVLFAEKVETHLPLDTVCRLWRYRPDVVVSGELGVRTMGAALYRLLRPGARLVIWATLSERTEKARISRLRLALRKWLLSRADAVVVNGAGGRRYIEALGFPPSRIREMPYSVDHGHFSGSATRSTDTAHRLLAVGQLAPRKGLHPWLSTVSAWARAHADRRLEIWIAGDGTERATIAAADYPPNMTVRLLGAVSYDALPNIYRQCGILAFPTLADEWGVVVNEAMATGLPVLGSIHSQAVEEMVREGETGWLFDAESADDSYAALDRAMTTTAVTLDRMRAAATREVARFAPDEAARMMRAACALARDAN